MADRLEREWRSRLIEPALKHPRHSEQRAAAIRAVVSAPERHPTRGAVPVSERSLQRWIADYDTLGLAGLQRRKRRDDRSTKVFVSRPWDGAVPFDDAVKAGVGGQVHQDLRNLWGAGKPYSVVRRLASEGLEARTRALGFDPGPEALAQICRLPKSVVETERDASRVHQYRTDAKGWNDRRSRVRRSPDPPVPMQIVIADVHHVDVLIERPDGSTTTPKLIAWMDVATHRVRADLVLCELGTAVRNADLIESFVDMALDPEWGVPAGLYVDNGSEFRFADFLSDAMRLADLRVFGGSPAGPDPVKRSTPYEAASKGLLEGAFRVLQQQVFAGLPGFIGGDRMNSKSATLGRPQLPFPGGFDAFAPVVRNGIAYHNTNERRGGLRGRTPDQVFRAFVDRGLKRTDIDADELTMAFSVDETRKVRQGKITVSLPGDPRGSITYVHDMLGRFEGQAVRVRLPKFARWDGIPVYALKGERIGVAMPEPVYGYLAITVRDGAAAEGRDVRAAAFGAVVDEIDARRARANREVKAILERNAAAGYPRLYER